jgi:hypothetical protein
MAHNKFQEGGWSGVAYGMNSVERGIIYLINLIDSLSKMAVEILYLHTTTKK